QRIEAEAAHRVDDARRQDLGGDAEMREPAAEAAAQRHGAVVGWRAENERLRMRLAQRQQRRQRREIMLAVGVDLCRVAEAGRARQLESLGNRTALALVLSETKDDHAI